MVDALAMRFETVRYAWDPKNPLSGEKPNITGSVRPRLRSATGLGFCNRRHILDNGRLKEPNRPKQSDREDDQ